ncbi:MAG: hypothetical protein E7589_00720 [Ruminococcaceae bacterium]|nr:hypothetical protein [Oscillospiraceae bacterium]MBE6902875.1 hypothetical protein [Oscillospiraceae bacterium]
MEYVLYFLEIVLYTIGTVCICGLVVALCEWLFRLLLGGGAGYKAVLITAIVGTPIHELGHAVMCLIFRHKINEICLWDPHATDGTLGYVNHSYNPKNIYHRIGNLFIGLGPIFSGLGVLTLLMFLVFPDTTNAYFTNAASIVRTDGNIFMILVEGLKMIPAMFTEESVNIWLRILAVIVMLSVSLHISLSPADIKGSLSALPFYFGAVLLVTVITSLIGRAAMSAVSTALATFNAYLVMLFTIVFVFSVILVLIALIVFGIRMGIIKLIRR